MNKIIQISILFLAILIFTSCGSNTQITKQNQNEIVQQNNSVGIVSELLEEARQYYVVALKKQELNSTMETVENYEAALRIINNLS